LYKKCKGEYVAIYQGKLIGHHPDDSELARRASQKVGHVPFLLTRVSRHRPIAVFDSPEEFNSVSIHTKSGGNKMRKNLMAKSRHIKGPLEDPSEAEFRAFRKMLPRLLKRYEGEYVAIYKGKLIGHDFDDRELARRTFKKLGDVSFLIFDMK
jgi:hypothetical protein